MDGGDDKQEPVLPDTLMQFYRSTAVGLALHASLNTILESKEITSEQANEILVCFLEYVKCVVNLVQYDFDSCVETMLRRNLCLKKKFSVLEMEV